MKELVAYWQDKYDWRAQEKKLNELPQFVTEIDGLDDPLRPRPLEGEERPAAGDRPRLARVVLEFHKVIGPLTDPVAHGGKAEDAFHVVCPSLPGFGFSGKPTERGLEHAAGWRR